LADVSRGRTISRILVPLVIVFVITACSQPQRRVDPSDTPPRHRQKPSDTSLARRGVIFDSLLSALARRMPETPPAPWTTTTLPRRWTNLEMTDTAFVVYDRCDGATPTIAIGRDTLAVNFVWEAEHFVRPVITRLADDRFRIDAELTYPCDSAPTPTRFDITVLDWTTGLSTVHWQWQGCGAGDDRTWLMVPSANTPSFATIERVCRENKLLEHEFLEPPFDR
jgi:hypothetical protein